MPLPSPLANGLRSLATSKVPGWVKPHFGAEETQPALIDEGSDGPAPFIFMPGQSVAAAIPAQAAVDTTQNALVTAIAAFAEAPAAVLQPGRHPGGFTADGGLRHAIEVRDQPNDPTWDPDDIRYSTVRWITSDRSLFAALRPGDRGSAHGRDFASGDRHRRRSAAFDQTRLRRSSRALARDGANAGRLTRTALERRAALRRSGRVRFVRHGLGRPRNARRDVAARGGSLRRPHRALCRGLAADGRAARVRAQLRLAPQFRIGHALLARADPRQALHGAPRTGRLRDGLHAGQSIAPREGTRRLLSTPARPL